jgi:Zn ribbon nucleic-acid-binding protein
MQEYDRCPAGYECPNCGEEDTEHLAILDDDGYEIECCTCGITYIAPGQAWQQPAIVDLEGFGFPSGL